VSSLDGLCLMFSAAQNLSYGKEKVQTPNESQTQQRKL
jgi:hypothetical protein